ncbi:MAG: hypothetical protein ACYC3X_06585 [Pirellulaceae bacterium]
MAVTEYDKSSNVLDASARRFVLWCLDALGLPATTDERGIYRIEVAGAKEKEAVGAVPLHPYAGLAGRRFVFDRSNGQPDGDSETVEQVTLESPLSKWLWEELRSVAWPVQAVAAHQPISVHELTTQLFAPYDIAGGRVHLSGCSLEDRPFLRLTFLSPPSPSGAPQIVHCFGTSDGQLLDEPMMADLELNQLTPLAGRTPRLGSGVLQQWTDVTRRHFEASHAVGEWALLAATLVWCKYAEGKLTFSIGAKSVDVGFAGWGKLFADRLIMPPPYTCPLSSRSSYRLAATDDGRITVAEGIASCDVSARRVLVEELQRCSETGRQVLPEFLRTCPVTGQRVLESLLQTCSMCQQQVSSKALDGDRCAACHRLSPTTKSDPRMARVLDAYPKLDRWRSWRIAETRSVQIMVGTSTLHRLLVVLDKHTLDVLHVASGSRMSSRWTVASDVQRTEWVA